MKKIFACLLFLVTSLVHAQNDKATYQEFSLDVEASNRYFFQDGLYPGQKRNYLSLSIQPEYLYEWKDGKHSIKFVGFARLDQHDSRRTHAD
ncbi:MAG: hypothetical protein AAFN93_28065, partial [Bacteroidota bacterium]